MNAYELIKLHEGFELYPYKCPAGKLTIGYGRNIEDNGISEEEAELMLANDIQRCVLELKRVLPWYDGLDDVRQAVLIDMCYNLGISRLLKFKRFLSALEQDYYDLAAREMLDSLWAKQVGQRAERLALIMKTGEWHK